jgi:XTP/dITP diphosphohydrolase
LVVDDATHETTNTHCLKGHRMKTSIGGSRIVLASNNAGKIREIRALLAEHAFDVIPQAEFRIAEADETGLTFIENAILKARHAADQSGLPAIADDSGLEVDALDGAPGVHSAYYAGRGASDQANVDQLLAAMESVPEGNRSARFHCVMVLLRHALDPSPLISHGVWEGQIAFAPRGATGFGYDPVFLLPEGGCTAAELDPAEKNRRSHRGHALRELVAQIGRSL